MKQHARKLIRLLRELPFLIRQGAEIGIWQGETSEQLLRTFPKLTLWMIDPWAKEYEATAEQIAAAEVLARKRTAFAGPRQNIIKASSLWAAQRLTHSVFDFVFIDACHDYESIRDDLQAWYPKVKPGGLVSGHDYNSVRDRHGIWGVTRAVDEFAAEHGYDVHSDGLVWWFDKRK